ncbi:1292_t:CDS:2 [Ambispora gerdemannii]|uniref:Dihydrofolate synthetase n=1 Tax=Ambispora gerdemannii TaxID=144530 RepID=A0A9N9F7V0_9GLOM|nr:1292_t:CDS:2 [Ambispora gerdemannii]
MASKITWDLRRIYSLLNQLNNPHTRLSAIHITGTNGKGSTSSYIDNILLKAGYKTGRYNSPHLLEPRDSIRINGQITDRQDYRELSDSIYAKIRAADIDASPFEALTALAFYWFDLKKVDVVVVEVGLGGTHDATNVFDKPLASVISSIGLDHEEILGNNVEKIAHEKAGIIKNGSLAVIGPQKELAAINAIKTYLSEEIKVDHVEWVKPAVWDLSSKESGWANLSLKDNYDEPSSSTSTIRLKIPLYGDYQLENVATAVTTIDLLRKKLPQFSKITDMHIFEGIASTKWPGRLQYLDISPLVAKEGKDFSSILRVLLRKGDSFLPVSFSKVEEMFWVKPTETSVLASLANNLELDLDIREAGSLINALNCACEIKEQKGGNIVISGSLYMIADLYRLLKFDENYEFIHGNN